MSEIYEILPLIVFIINIFLAGLVIRSNWGSFRHRILAAFLTAMSLWGLTIFGMRSSPDLASAFLWDKAALCVIPLVTLLFFHFSLRFTYTRFNQGILVSLYLLVGVMMVLSVSGMIATEMQQKWYGYAPVVSPIFPLYLVVAYLPTVMAFVVLVKARRRSRSSQERVRISYIILAAAASTLGGTSDYLPVLGLNIYPMGMVANIVFGVLTTIAVTRHQLIELPVLLRRGFAYSLISSTIFAAYGVIFLIFSIAFRNQTATASVIAGVGALILATIVLPPAISRVQSWVDHLFFRQRFDHLLALQQFTNETRDIGDLVGLASSLTNTVRLAMQAHWAVLLLPQGENGDFSPIDSPSDDGESNTGHEWPQGVVIRRTSPIPMWLERNERALPIQELEVDPYLQGLGDDFRVGFERSGTQLIVPLKSKGGLTGILVLGPKLVEGDYSRRDIDLLTTVSSQTATMIENARLYNQEMARLVELEQLENLKSNLLRTVSHELKSPLTAIKTSVDLLTSTEGPMEERASIRLMRALRSGVDRFERLLDESLDYAQMQSAQLELRLEMTDFPKLVDDALDLVGPSMSAKRQTVSVHVSPDLPRMLVDARRIERVLLNLLSNATKYAPVGGEISLKVWEEDAQVVAEVTNNGTAVPENERELLFHEFYRGNGADRQNTPGTGLGLAISRYLVELHGGEIAIRKGNGAGTTFYFTLPVSSGSGLGQVSPN